MRQSTVSGNEAGGEGRDRARATIPAKPRVRYQLSYRTSWSTRKSLHTSNVCHLTPQRKNKTKQNHTVNAQGSLTHYIRLLDSVCVPPPHASACPCELCWDYSHVGGHTFPECAECSHSSDESAGSASLCFVLQYEIVFYTPALLSGRCGLTWVYLLLQKPLIHWGREEIEEEISTKG